MMEEVKENMEIPRSESDNVPKIEVENGCFVCHGSGHWAREVKLILIICSTHYTILVYIFAFHLFD